MQFNSRLLFDLDETIYMGDIVKTAVDQLISEGIDMYKFDGSDAEDYSFSNFPEILRERIMKLFKDPTVGCINKYVLPGIYTLLYYIVNVKHWPIGFVTARPDILREPTNYVIYRDFKGVQWTNSYFPNNTNGYSGDFTKEAAIKDFQPTHFFDDHYDYCLQAAKLKVPHVYMITNSHTGWNHKHIKNGDIIKNNITPIKSILELDVR